MKANELRIGNWVCFIDEIVCISAIKNNLYEGNGAIRINRNKILWHSLDDFKPIPLTKEWLLRFGFSKTESNEYYQFYDLDNFRVFLGIKVTQSVFVTWKDCQIEDSVNNLSVHQLQNLYFALTGQELELKEL